MDFEDYMEPEVAVAVALTAAVASPKVRQTIRKGAVFGLAGLLKAGDAIRSFTASMARGARDAATEADEDGQEAAEGAKHAKKRRVVVANE